jgi:hypothetical protein
LKDVIVTGGRDYYDKEKVISVLSLLDIGLLIQGGANGADLLAKEYAQFHNIPRIEVKADWSKHGRAAGPIRNKEMLLEFPNAIVIAFPGGAGTANCVKQAVELNRIVLMVHK